MAAKKILTPYDFNKNQIQNVVMHQLATDPSGGSLTEGLFWWNTTSHSPKVYTGSTVIDLFNPVLLNGQAGSFYLARANHTGTQLAATISDFDTQVRTSRLDQMAAPNTSVSMNSQKLTSLANGTSANDAVNFGQLTAAVQGLSWKTSVRAASLANGTLATAFENGDSLDGVTLATGDRILLKNQTAGAENGIYTVNASGAPTRALDADTGTELENASVFVDEGTQAGTAWNQTADGITVGTTALTWVQFAGGGSYTAAAPITLTGNVFGVSLSARVVNTGGSLDLASGVVAPGTYTQVTVDTYGRVTAGADMVSANGIVTKTAAGTFTSRTITGTASRLTVTNGDGVAGNPTLDISASYVGQASITTLGTITTGVWNGTTIAVANGGTGATTAAGARSNLGATGKFSALIGDGSSTSITITQATHGLANSTQNLVQVFDASTGAEVECDITVAPATGNVTFAFSVAPTTNALRVVLVG